MAASTAPTGASVRPLRPRNAGLVASTSPEGYTDEYADQHPDVNAGDHTGADPNVSAEDTAAQKGLQRWVDARLIAALLAVNPVGLGGVHVQSPPGPVRDEWLRTLAQALPQVTNVRRMPQHADESRLLGGLDLAATLAAGKPVLQPGLLSELKGGLLACPMAERLARRTVAHLCQALDRHQVRLERDGMGMEIPAQLGVIALDESCGEDDAPGLEPALRERLALVLDLQDLDWRHCGLSPLSAPDNALWNTLERQDLEQARTALGQVQVPDSVVHALVVAAEALGVASPRAPWWAVQVARTLAAMRELDEPGAQEVRDAARLVLGPRATRLPASASAEDVASDPTQAAPAANDEPTPPPAADQVPEPTEPEPEKGPEDSHAMPSPADAATTESTETTDPPPPVTPTPDNPGQDLSVEAVQAALPAGLLALMAQRNGLGARGRPVRDASSRAGDRQRAGAQGRPCGSRPGLPQAGRRLSLMDTLRQAAPWQRLRHAQHSPTGPTSASPASVRTTHHSFTDPIANAGTRPPRVIVHRDDLRVVHRQPRRPSTTVFVVDASGSNALHRLAEAKGAVETLLADCYVRRDRVAVIGFRGTGAETLLPPTRSLVRAKRSLAGLPGGGGTPMAHALTTSRLLCESLQRRGDTVSLVLLTDGKSNISLQGLPGRAQAHADAITAARALFVRGTACLLIDTSPKPQSQAKELALAMGARYIPLPQAQSGEIGRIVRNSRAT